MVGCFVRFVDNIQLEKLKQHDMRSYNEEMEVKIFFKTNPGESIFELKSVLSKWFSMFWINLDVTAQIQTLLFVKKQFYLNFYLNL